MFNMHRESRGNTAAVIKAELHFNDSEKQTSFNFAEEAEKTFYIVK